MVTKAKINSAMMKWAREYAGFTHGHEERLPKDIKSKYEAWEKGENSPTWNQLREVSKKYHIPTAFFFMDCPPNFDNLPNMINYRKLVADSIYETNSPNLINNIRKSETRREIYLDLLNELNEDILLFKVPKLEHDTKIFSNYIREILDISLSTQKSWYKEVNHYNFLNKWKEVLNEKLGVLIFETEGVLLEEMRALCIFHEKIPIILLNGKDSVNGRIFSLFHELTHLLLGESAICGDDENTQEEIFCNAVAGEFLVPEHDLNISINGVTDLLSYNSLKKLYNSYRVSEHVILRRLLDANKISRKDYISHINSYEESFSKSSGSGGNYLNNMIKYNGKAYYSVILDAYEVGIINSLEFSKFTDLGKKQIPKLQESFYGGE
ncbi:MAG: ImmA/IrrE family metallo-endopeptidase [Methanobrevibacter smithii]|nr:ImmA/IrrE family metallo-endopeptidase [Methanobrevibacter smithii]MDO5830906.1 ImmA/IrrE family metallo-endopeptidase [Methanobrevibacter smithii]